MTKFGTFSEYPEAFPHKLHVITALALANILQREQPSSRLRCSMRLRNTPGASDSMMRRRWRSTSSTAVTLDCQPLVSCTSPSRRWQTSLGPRTYMASRNATPCALTLILR